MTTTPEQRAEWKALCEKASAAPWDMDRERQDDSPDRHYEFAVFDGEGRRLFGTENRDANAGLLEVEYDEEGATVWNELSRRDIAFAVESRTALPALISHIEALEAENARLKEALAWFHHNGKALASDIYSAHRLRGNGASQWMTEDDRDFRRDLDAALDRTRAAMGESE